MRGVEYVALGAAAARTSTLSLQALALRRRRAQVAARARRQVASLRPRIAEEAHFLCAYPAAELGTFHYEHVRKMPLTRLDPSMLIGFLLRTIFSIKDEPPTWPGADDDMGLESISDP
ncbi:hypothetical protein B0H14DRAFT_3510007 [Mycena olivaceomarginata]|nr:hypothetical protein B0H14DRAFT_3510007 [Mycena olivaceomarginata]